MRFGYDSAILELAPALVAGVIWCRYIDNSRPVSEINALLQEASHRAKQRYDESADIARDPAIAD